MSNIPAVVHGSAAGLNYAYFCPFCLKVTVWHGSAEGQLGAGGRENGGDAI